MKTSVNMYPELNSGISVNCSINFKIQSPGETESAQTHVVVPLYAYVNGIRTVASITFLPYEGKISKYSLASKYLEAGVKFLTVPVSSIEERGQMFQLITGHLKKAGLYGLADPKAGGHMRVFYASEEVWEACGINIKSLGSKALKIFKLLVPPVRGTFASSHGLKGPLRVGLVAKQESVYSLNGEEYSVPSHDGPIYGRVAVFALHGDSAWREELTECQVRLPFHGQGKGLYICCPSQFAYLCGIGGFDPKDIHMVATMDAIKGPGYKPGDIIEIDLYNDKDAFRLLKFKESQGRSSISTQSVVYRDWNKIQSLLSDKIQDQIDEFGKTVSDYIYDVLQHRDAESLEFLTIGKGSSDTAIADNTSHIIKNLCFAMWRPLNKRWEFPSYSALWTQNTALMYSVYKDRCLKVRVGDQNFYVAYDNNLKDNQVSMPIQNSFCKTLLDELNGGKYLNASRAPFVSTYSISDIDPLLEDGTIRYNPTKYTVFCSPEFFTGFWMDGDGDLMMVWTSRVSFPYVQMPAPEDVKVYAKPSTDIHNNIADQFDSAVAASSDIGKLDMVCRYSAVVRELNNDPISDEESSWMGYVREVLTIKATKHHRGLGSSDSSYEEDIIKKILGNYLFSPWVIKSPSGEWKLPKVGEQEVIHELARKDAGLRLRLASNKTVVPTDSQCMSLLVSKIRKAKSEKLFNRWPWASVVEKLGTLNNMSPKHSDSAILKQFFLKKFEFAKDNYNTELIKLACDVANQIIDHYKFYHERAKRLASGDKRFSILSPYIDRKACVVSSLKDGELIVDRIAGVYEDIEVLVEGKISSASKAYRYTLIREWVEKKYTAVYDFILPKIGKELSDVWLRILGWRLGSLTFGTNTRDGADVSFSGSEYWYMPDYNLIRDAVDFSAVREADSNIQSPVNPWAKKYSDPVVLEQLRLLQEKRNLKKAILRSTINSGELEEEGSYDMD